MLRKGEENSHDKPLRNFLHPVWCHIVVLLSMFNSEMIMRNTYSWDTIHELLTVCGTPQSLKKLLDHFNP